MLLSLQLLGADVNTGFKSLPQDLIPAAGVVRRRGPFHRGRAGDGEQLAAVHPLVDAQLAPVLQHAHRYPGDVAGVVQAAVGAALVLHPQLLQHGAQLRLRAGHLEETPHALRKDAKPPKYTGETEL